MFWIFDSERHGRVDMKELALCLEIVCGKKETLLDTIFTICDDNGDEIIDWKEFIRLINYNMKFMDDQDKSTLKTLGKDMNSNKNGQEI